jgi:hypothetical protein
MKNIVRLICGPWVLVAALVLIAGLALANSSAVGAPGYSGRPQADVFTNTRLQSNFDHGWGDASLGQSVSGVASAVSAPINISTTAGLAAGASNYTGPFGIYVVNTSLSSLVAFLSMTKTPITSSTPAGAVVAAGSSVFIEAQPRSGLTLHLQGLTSTVSANYSVWNQ